MAANHLSLVLFLQQICLTYGQGRFLNQQYLQTTPIENDFLQWTHGSIGRGSVGESTCLQSHFSISPEVLITSVSRKSLPCA